MMMISHRFRFTLLLRSVCSSFSPKSPKSSSLLFESRMQQSMLYHSTMTGLHGDGGGDHEPSFAKSAQRVEIRTSPLTDEQIDEMGKLEPFDGNIPREKLVVGFSRSGGPGGQNVNKVNTKCDVRFHVDSADWLPAPVKLQLKHQQSTRINARGELCLQSSVYRTQEQNLKDAMDKIRDMVEQAYVAPEKRVLTLGRTKGGDEKRLREKKQGSQKKEGRRNLKNSSFD